MIIATVVTRPVWSGFIPTKGSGSVHLKGKLPFGLSTLHSVICHFPFWCCWLWNYCK